VKKLEQAISAVLRDPEIGRDLFATTQVAVLAGVSIGTVYRYFLDRAAMVDRVWPDRKDTFLLAETVDITEGAPQDNKQHHR
jgi:AcrR family transcriptional regulator